jgi:hypothetical protein
LKQLQIEGRDSANNAAKKSENYRKSAYHRQTEDEKNWHTNFETFQQTATNRCRNNTAQTFHQKEKKKGDRGSLCLSSRELLKKPLESH